MIESLYMFYNNLTLSFPLFSFFPANLCRKVKCKKPRGSWCQVVDVEGVPTPKCVCPENCDGEPEKPVCSVYGKQYDNKCSFHKYSCKKRKAIPLAFEKACIGEYRSVSDWGKGHPFLSVIKKNMYHFGAVEI